MIEQEEKRRKEIVKLKNKEKEVEKQNKVEK